MRGMGRSTSSGYPTSPASADWIATEYNNESSPTTFLTLGPEGRVGQSYTISGTVTLGGNGLSGVTMALSGGQSGSVTTPASGNYSFTVSSGGSYAVTPTLTGIRSIRLPVNSVTSPQTCNFTAAFTGFPNTYNYYRTIVVNCSKVPNTDQANFPLLVSLTDSALATTANGGHVTSGSGYDIIFTSDSGCQTKLNHEIETWTARQDN